MDISQLGKDLEILRGILNDMDILQAMIARQREPEQTAHRHQLLHERSVSGRALIDKILGDLGLADGSIHMSDYDRARVGLPAND
jgi:hypothetical protein